MRQVEESMASRIFLTMVLFLCSGFEGSIAAQSSTIRGTYRNPALGYSIRIPDGLKGTTGDQDGPERGVGISLPSGGTIIVFGEPNSLEWKTPEQGINDWMARPDCASRASDARPAPLGKLHGATGTVACSNRVLKSILAFRSGGPIYWLRLETTPTHESEDNEVLQRIATSFRLIRWN